MCGVYARVHGSPRSALPRSDPLFVRELVTHRPHIGLSKVSKEQFKRDRLESDNLELMLHQIKPQRLSELPREWGTNSINRGDGHILAGHPATSM